MIVSLVDADVRTCGTKAGTLGALLRAGLPVPDGFVIPFAEHLEQFGTDLAPALAALGDLPVAVRSSASNEDGGQSSAAGRYDSVLAVQGSDAVARAIRICRSSVHSGRSPHRSVDVPEMAVLVQRLVDADVAGVLFTPTIHHGVTTIEASWGLGPSIVGGTVTPDTFRVHADGTVDRRIVTKRTRLDRGGPRLVRTGVPASDVDRPCLDDPTARRLAILGDTVAARLGRPQDVEWAISGDDIWLLQARPITADLPSGPRSLAGTPGSPGTATGTVRVVRRADDFDRVRPGDILVCPYTDPAWIPLLRIVAGVITEVGGVLSHAAIVAREQRIPAVLGIADATSRLRDGATITIDGTTGTIL